MIDANQYLKINDIHGEILHVVESYVSLISDLELREEEDYKDFSDAILAKLLLLFEDSR